MKVSADTSVLFYAFDAQAGERHDAALAIVDRLFRCDTVLPAQVFGEMAYAIRRKMPDVFETAVDLMRDWTALVAVELTTIEDILAGAALARVRKIQTWDAVILSVARRAGASVLLAEDMQDGATIGGVTLLNPFDPANRARLDAALA